jgi:hypothetical protein
MATTTVNHEHGLLAGFHSAWSLVQHGSVRHINMHLANLKAARAVCLHLADDLDHLIKLAEAKLAEHEQLEKNVAAFDKVCAERS